MKKKYLISIIMNCHNGEKYLKNSIKSILNQKYKYWELIFWDNQSKDNSAEIVKSIRDKRIKYFKSQKFVSLYYARNLAVKKIKGNFITFLDTDDLWKKNFLFECVKQIQKKRCDIVSTKYFIKNIKTKKLYINEKNKLPEILSTQQLLNNYTISISGVMVRDYILKKFKFNNKYNIIGDFDYFIRLSKVYKIFTINKPLIIYRHHKKNFSQLRLDIYLKEFLHWINLFEKKNKKKFILIKLKIFLIKLRIKLLFKIFKFI